MAELRYKTDFEDIVKVDTHHLSIPIPHWFETSGEGGASMWMEGLDRIRGPTPHSGSRCVGMELTDISLSLRSEFKLNRIRELAGEDVFLSVWLYLPPNWGLHAPIDWNWYQIVNPLTQIVSPWHPYLEVNILERGMGGGTGIFGLSVGGRNQAGEHVFYKTVADFPLPRGRWFNLKWYLIRDDVNSSIKIWLDGILICDVSGIPLPILGDDYGMIPAKIYHDKSDKTPHYIWMDDLEIWSGMPTPVPPPMALAWLTSGLAPVITMGSVVAVQELKKLGIIP